MGRALHGEIHGLNTSRGHMLLRWEEWEEHCRAQSCDFVQHFPGDRAANAKQGQEQTPGLQRKLGVSSV